MPSKHGLAYWNSILYLEKFIEVMKVRDKSSSTVGNSKGDPWVFSHSPLPLPSKTLTLDKDQGFDQGSRFPDPYPYPSVKPFTTLEGFYVKEGHIALAMSEQVLFSVYKAF